MSSSSGGSWDGGATAVADAGTLVSGETWPIETAPVWEFDEDPFPDDWYVGIQDSEGTGGGVIGGGGSEMGTMEYDVPQPMSKGSCCGSCAEGKECQGCGSSMSSPSAGGGCGETQTAGVQQCTGNDRSNTVPSLLASLGGIGGTDSGPGGVADKPSGIEVIPARGDKCRFLLIKRFHISGSKECSTAMMAKAESFLKGACKTWNPLRCPCSDDKRNHKGRECRADLRCIVSSGDKLPKGKPFDHVSVKCKQGVMINPKPKTPGMYQPNVRGNPGTIFVRLQPHNSAAKPNASPSVFAHEVGHSLGASDTYDSRTGKEIPGYQGDVMGIGYPNVRPTLEHYCMILYKLDICEGKDDSGRSKCCPGGIKWWGYGTPSRDPDSKKPFDITNTFEGTVTAPDVVPGSDEYFMGAARPADMPR
jgi:hypothetical protein